MGIQVLSLCSVTTTSSSFAIRITARGLKMPYSSSSFSLFPWTICAEIESETSRAPSR